MVPPSSIGGGDATIFGAKGGERTIEGEEVAGEPWENNWASKEVGAAWGRESSFWGESREKVYIEKVTSIRPGHRRKGREKGGEP